MEKEETNPIKIAMAEYKKKTEKSDFIRTYKTDVEYERINNVIEKHKINEQVEFGLTKEDRIKQIQDDILSRIDDTKVISPFMGFPAFNEINMSGSNLLLVGGLSGTGKSTICANLAIKAFQKKEKVLIITNEETVNDCYLRLACLLFGMNINKVANWSQQEIDKISRVVPLIAQRITVIDDTHEGGTNITTSLEGIEFVCKSLLKSDFKYDLIIIDYYQNYVISTKNDKMTNYQVQDQFGFVLDRFKNDYKRPIVILAQMSEEIEGKPKPFKERIEGRKSIYNRCTMAIETTIKKELLCTDFILRKGRFNDNLGTVTLGFNKGFFVEYTPDFKNQVQQHKQAREISQLLKKDSDK